MKFIYVVLLLIASLTGFTQQNHFIYIQTGNKQPFYVKLDKKLLSSSVSGYLIVPKLRDSVYHLVIGFPKNEWAEQKITCKIDQADAGYLLKNFGERGWGLFNFQTMNLVMADTAIINDQAGKYEKNNDEFTNILASVVNDPGLKEPDMILEEPKPEIGSVKKVTHEKKGFKKSIKTILSPIQKAGYHSRIAKLSYKKSRDSLRMVYVDKINGKADTINVEMALNLPHIDNIVKKKITKPVAVVAKLHQKHAAPLKDTTAIVLAEKKIIVEEKKAEEPVIDLSKTITDPMNPAKDSTAIVLLEKKPDNQVADNIRKVIDNVIPSKDSSAIVGIVKKAEKPVEDSIKTVQDQSIPAKDSTAIVVVEKKVETPAQDSIKTVRVQEVPSKDTLALVITEKKEEKAVEDSIRPVKVMSNAVIDTTVIVVAEKKELLPLIDTTRKSAEIISPDISVSADTLQKRPEAGVIAEKKADTPVNIIKVDTVVVESIKPNAPKVFRACNSEATGEDFLGLLKKMTRAGADEDKMILAHKAFLKMCYNTRHLGRLSLSFGTDEEKYRFFEEAYSYVTDRENFAGLASLLKDAIYIDRFNALIH